MPSSRDDREQIRRDLTEQAHKDSKQSSRDSGIRWKQRPRWYLRLKWRVRKWVRPKTWGGAKRTDLWGRIGSPQPREIYAGISRLHPKTSNQEEPRDA